MKRITITVALAAAFVVPAPAGAQTKPEKDPRVRVPSRVVVEQRQRPRPVAAQEREEQTERITRSVRIGANGVVLVSNIAGEITITRGGGNEVQIEAIKIARARTVDEAREMLPLVTVDVAERGDRVEIRTNYPRFERSQQQRHRNMNVSVNYNITAPQGTRIKATSISGNIGITDIKGDLSATSISGNVVITNAERLSSARSTSGNVEISNTNSEVPFDVGSVSGDVTLRKVKAPRLQVNSVSGNVILKEIEAPHIEAKSIVGNVDLAFPFAKGGRYDVSSHSGTVTIAVIGGAGFEVEVTTFSGTIQADAALNLKKESDSEDRRPRQRALRAVYGDGSAMVDVSTFSGRVVLTRR